MALAYKLLTVEEFLDACPNDQRHYQLFDGVIVAMAPPGGRHQIIAAAIGALLYLAVEGVMPGCSVRSQAGIAPQGVSGGTISKPISRSLVSHWMSVIAEL
jgi:Uma2 family endonuclease